MPLLQYSSASKPFMFVKNNNKKYFEYKINQARKRHLGFGQIEGKTSIKKCESEEILACV